MTPIDDPRADRPARAAYLRLGGRSTLTEGGVLVWSVAEGRRGRRWRGRVVRHGRLAWAVLLELTPAGRPARLEITTDRGLLTLHPEPDERTIHGNLVDADGVAPIARGWSPDHELELVGLPFGTAAALARRRATTGVGERASFPVLAVGADLRVAEGRRTAVRVTPDTWQVSDGPGRESALTVDGRGLFTHDLAWELEPEVWEDRGQEAP